MYERVSKEGEHHQRYDSCTIGEKMKESQMILITLGGLGNGYESIVTSLTTRSITS